MDSIPLGIPSFRNYSEIKNAANLQTNFYKNTCVTEIKNVANQSRAYHELLFIYFIFIYILN